MIRLAFGSKCVPCGKPAVAADARCSLPSRLASAATPTPVEPVLKKCRRLNVNNGWFMKSYRRNVIIGRCDLRGDVASLAGQCFGESRKPRQFGTLIVTNRTLMGPRTGSVLISVRLAEISVIVSQLSGPFTSLSMRRFHSSSPFFPKLRR
jgi:hypothetical protein